jgi:hypothetical protein
VDFKLVSIPLFAEKFVKITLLMVPLDIIVLLIVEQLTFRLDDVIFVFTRFVTVALFNSPFDDNKEDTVKFDVSTFIEFKVDVVIFEVVMLVDTKYVLINEVIIELFDKMLEASRLFVLIEEIEAFVPLIFANVEYVPIIFSLEIFVDNNVDAIALLKLTLIRLILPNVIFVASKLSVDTVFARTVTLVIFVTHYIHLNNV